MIYVFDTSSILVLGNYYPTRFPTLWSLLDELVANGGVTSTREVMNELKNTNTADNITAWVDGQKAMFPIPSSAETEFVAKIYAVPHFSSNISQKAILRGTPFADPFVIARAFAIGGVVVTQETEKPHAAKIPNICKHFSVPCVMLEDFMEAQDWKF